MSRENFVSSKDSLTRLLNDNSFRSVADIISALHYSKPAFRPIIQDSDFSCKFGYMHNVNAPSAGIKCFLPKATEKDIGKSTAIINTKSLLYNINIMAQDGCTVNGASQKTVQIPYGIAYILYVGNNQWVVTSTVAQEVYPPLWPRFYYHTNKIARCVAGSDVFSTMRLYLSDGVMRTASGTLSLDVDASGPGGIDAAESAAAGWLNIFAIPDPVNSSQFVLVGSYLTAPGSHSVYRFVFSVRSFLSGGAYYIANFYHRGDRYFNHNYTDTFWTLYSETGGTPTTSTWTSLNTALLTSSPLNFIDEVGIHGWLDVDFGGATNGWNILLLAPANTAGTHGNYSPAKFVSSHAGDSTHPFQSHDNNYARFALNGSGTSKHLYYYWVNPLYGDVDLILSLRDFRFANWGSL
jgi:hypothetical protein